MRDIFAAILKASQRGKGLRLSAEEVALMAQDYAICMAPADVRVDEAERQKEQALRDIDRAGGKEKE